MDKKKIAEPSKCSTTAGSLWLPSERITHEQRQQLPQTAPSRRNTKEIRPCFFLPSTHWRSTSEDDPDVETEQDTEQELR